MPILQPSFVDIGLLVFVLPCPQTNYTNGHTWTHNLLVASDNWKTHEMSCPAFFFKAEIFTVAAKLKSVSMHTLSEVGVKGLNDIFPNQFGIFGGPATWIGMDKGVFYGGFIW